MKFCKDCKHYIKRVSYNGENLDKCGRKVKTEEVQSPVTGIIEIKITGRNEYAELERSGYKKDGCGIGARYFEPKQ